MLAGSSGGGYVAASFAAKHPREISGLLLIDSGAPFSNPPPDLAAASRNADTIERKRFLEVEKDAWRTRAQIRNIPMTVISVDYGSDAADENERLNAKRQKGWLTASSRARQLVVQTGHVVHHDDPDLVIEQIEKVVNASRRK